MKILVLQFCLILIIGSVGCKKVSESQKNLISDSLEAIKANVLTPDKMRKVLLGLHIAEAKLQFLNFSQDSNLVLSRAFKQNVFDKLKIDTGYFRKSYKFYAENPFIYDRLYESVNDSLSMRQTHNNINF